MQIEFEPLSLATGEIATRLMLELWDDADYEEELTHCRQMLQGDKETIFLCKMAGVYIGFIYLGMRVDYVEGTSSSPVAYIEGIYVKPDFQGQGIGRQLVEMGEKWGKEKGAVEYASDVELPNLGSIAFHKSVGFEEINRVVCFSKRIAGT